MNTEQKNKCNLFSLEDENSKFMLIGLLIIGIAAILIVILSVLYYSHKNTLINESLKLEKYEASEIGCVFEIFSKNVCEIFYAPGKGIQINTKK